MQKVLAVNIKGQLTYCSVPPELRGIGRCNHINHQEEGETEQEFIERVDFGTADLLKHGGKVKEQTIELKQYKMSQEEKMNLPEFKGRTNLKDETNEGAYIHLQTPLWNDMDKSCFADISKNSVKSINDVINKEKHIITYLNRANPKAGKHYVGQICTKEASDKIKALLGKDVEFDTGVTGLNKGAYEGYNFEATTDVYVIPYFMRQEPPESEGSKIMNQINIEYNSLMVQDKDPDSQQLAYDRLLNNSALDDLVQEKDKINKGKTPRRAFLVNNKNFKTPSLSDLFKGKSGLLRGYMSGNTIPYSGRAVTTPDIDVPYGSVAIPPSILCDIFKPTIKDTLRQQGYSDHDINKWMNKYKTRQTDISESDRQELQQVIDWSDRRILGVRQPTLHESNLLCYKPIVSPDSTIHQNPMNLAGISGDHDGDTFTVFGINDVGISKLAEKEMGVATVSGTRRPRAQNQSLNLPAKESLFGLLQILGERDASERK